MEQNKLLERINLLAKKAGAEGLTKDEKREQRDLRFQYLKNFRKGLEQTLDNTVIVDAEGNRRKLTQKEEKEPYGL